MQKNVKCIFKRGSFKESEHFINSVVMDTNNKIIFKSGDIYQEYCMRSTLKPFQSAASLNLGTDQKYNFTNKEIAVTCASHHGEMEHIETVKSILTKIDCKESDLECGFHFPLDKNNKSQLHSNSVTKSNIYNNCSGKHAGLLGFIKHMGYNHKDYINHNHPIHAHINNYIQKKTSLESINFAIDGCSLPTPYFTLSTLASLYIQLLTAKKNSVLYKIYNAMTTYPQMISGSTGFDTYMMKNLNCQVISKGGAEGMQAIALDTQKYGPISITLKVSDGNHRANYISCIKILKYINAISEDDEKLLLKFVDEYPTNLNGIKIGQLICKIFD